MLFSLAVVMLMRVTKNTWWVLYRTRNMSNLSSLFTTTASRWRGTIRHMSVKRNKAANYNVWLIVIPVTTFGLGTWQVFRLQWKVNLIKKLEERTKEDTIALPADVQDRVEELEYRHVKVHGKFDHSKELFLWPRPLKLETGAGGHQHGAQVITPFQCKETGSTILINRGWVSSARMDADNRKEGQIEGEVTVTGVVRNSEKKSMFAPQREEGSNKWQFRDIEEMAHYVNCSPVLLDADATTTVVGGPIGGQTRISLRNDHLQYIFTWYVLTLATGYMLYRFVKRRRF